jgi:hypothetical protein
MEFDDGAVTVSRFISMARRFKGLVNEKSSLINRERDTAIREASKSAENTTLRAVLCILALSPRSLHGIKPPKDIVDAVESLLINALFG